MPVAEAAQIRDMAHEGTRRLFQQYPRRRAARCVILKGAVGKETEDIAVLPTELHDRFELRVPRADG